LSFAFPSGAVLAPYTDFGTLLEHVHLDTLQHR
jgi:hypothetical protein